MMGPCWLANNTQRREVKRGLPLDFLADFARAFDHDLRLEKRPLVGVRSVAALEEFRDLADARTAFGCLFPGP
jgi:hypothetical protein